MQLSPDISHVLFHHLNVTNLAGPLLHPIQPYLLLLEANCLAVFDFLRPSFLHQPLIPFNMIVLDSFADDADAGCVLVGGDEEVVDESVIVEDEEV